NISMQNVNEKKKNKFVSLNLVLQLQGCLIAAGIFHFLLGFTGLVGVILRFIGPITVVPTILLAIVFITRAATKFAMVYWGVSLPVAVVAIILSVYLAKWKCPIPFWSRKRGFHISHYPIHQVFSLLIAIIFGWILSGILTTAGVFSDEKSHREYLARTDAKTEFVGKAPWFNVPYPGQFGPISFSVSVFVGFLIATITSILDSIGDYYACAKMCEVPPPPSHAVNRGIAIEGLMSTISGFVGCGHATSTYGGNIGAIGITRVASRDVFLATGVIYVIFGIIGKVSAVFLTIPYPVLGGALIVMYGMFTGVVLSNLQVVSLSSSRNLAIIGISILFGLMIPHWVENFPDQVSVMMNKSQPMNSTSGGTELLDFQYEKSLIMLREGCLIAAGLCHFLVGLTGLVGVILRFVGPITILPTIFLAITYVTRATAKFAMVYWGVSLSVAAIAIILSVYLANFKCSIPVWTKKRGFHFSHYPIHQVFSLLIAIIIGWILCAILTTAGVFSDDKSHREYLARTDAKTEFIGKSPWFNIPYPGQFGSSKFNISVFVGFLIGTITSILDSIGDYHACAKMCDVPPPPPHAVNRGIAIEGLMSTISGFVGCGHATSTYGGNIGAIGITRVASRDVFLATGIIYVMFGIIGKVSAVFLTIPYPVLGGALIVMYGMFAGVVLSNLELISLSSSRNLAIIGISILFGLMMPYWVEKFPDQISVGSAIGDGVVKMLLANPSLIGGMLACILDNTVSGSDDERGISAWKTQIDDTRDNKREYSVGYEVYQPLLYDWIIKIPLINKLPIIPKKVN
ncbi:hypothetical protein FSP39_024507, partial [Pinctada imbricata]